MIVYGIGSYFCVNMLLTSFYICGKVTKVFIQVLSYDFLKFDAMFVLFILFRVLERSWLQYIVLNLVDSLFIYCRRIEQE